MNADDAAAALGKLIRTHRWRTGMTQQETARRAGLSAGALRNLEQGRVRTPRGATLSRLAQALGLTDPERDRLLAAAEPAARAAGGLRIEVLGPLRIRHNGSDVELGSPAQRTVLGLLALSPRRPVPSETLAAALWGDEPPAAATAMLQNHVSRLRRRLNAADAAAGAALVRTAGGYALRAEPGRLDVLDFEQLRDQARAAGGPDEACELYARCVALWRGPPLADLPALHIHPAVAHWTRARLEIAVKYSDVAEEVGRSAEVLPTLLELAGVDPLHEGVHARLMRTLAAGGQQAAALEVFERLRRRLDEELGAHPGPQLQAAHQSVLRRAADDSPPRPERSGLHQLPADIADFTGRSRELELLRGHLLEHRVPDTAVPVSVIQGMAGVGKTRLAVHFAHRLVAAGRHAEIQLYADLRGNSDRPPANPAVVLASFLRQLGMPGSEIPDDVAERAALYRDRLHGRQALILLDDAASLDQVRPLLPAGPANRVLITSRRALAVDGAQTVALDVLPADEAVGLLGRIAGPDRVHHEPAAAQRLATLCGYLPLALTLAGRRLLTRPGHDVHDLTDHLDEAADRVGELAAGDRRLRAVFDSSYDALAPPARRVLRLLGLHPGTDASSGSVAAMAGLDPASVRRHLERLVDEHLVLSEGPDRYRLHDLLRDYALTREAEEGQDGREAVARGARWYLYAADRAREAMYPHLRDLVPDPRGAPPHLPRFADGERAIRWLRAEHHSLIATVQAMADDGHDELAWQLPVLLKHYFERSGLYDDWVQTGSIALTATRRAGDRHGEAVVHGFLGVAEGQLTRLDAAVEHLTRAWRIASEVGAHLELAKIANNLGLAYRAQDRPAEAADTLRDALRMAGEVADRMLEIRVLTNLGWTHAALGAHEKAITALQQALELSRHEGDPVGVVAALQSLGDALVRAGRAAEAVPRLQEALDIYRRHHFRLYEAETLQLLGEALEATGWPAQARAHREEAEAIVEELRHRRPADSPA